jgi:uncharacterized protein YndB with AHSA1/START domain
MSERSVQHATFVVERTYDASPSRVFAAWADRAAKARWFGAESAGAEFELDFRVGGYERQRGSSGDRVYAVEARYQDIVPDERIVYSYDMRFDEQRISVSLSTVELAPAGDGTRLTYTEQGAFLDGLDTPDQREQGTGGLLEALSSYLESESSEGGKR